MNNSARRRVLATLTFALALLLLLAFGWGAARAADFAGPAMPAPEAPAVMPAVQFSPVTYNPGEGGVSITLDVTLSGTSTETVMVDYETIDGTALSGSDYAAKNGTLTFTPGDTLENIVIDITEDLVDEIDESFTVVLSNPISATLGMPDHVATVTITDNDAEPTVQFNPASYNVDENGVSKEIFVTLSAASGKTVMVNYATSNGTATAGSDYTSTSNTLTFNPGDTSKSFFVSITEDLIDEAAETIILELSGESNATPGAPDDQGTITINDNDDPPSVQFNPASYLVNEGDGTVTVFVTLSSTSGQTVTVDYHTSNDSAQAGQDYTATSDTLTFVPGDTSESFTVTINDDGKDEADESFNISLDPPVNASLGTSLATVTIQDNDSAPTVQFASADYPVGEGGGSVSVLVTLGSSSEQTVTVDYATNDGTATAGIDYTAASNTLTFVPGDVSESFSVSISPDSLDEFDETINLTLSNESNATLGTDTATITITDDDNPPSVRFSSSSYSEDENTGPATIGVQLTAPSGKPITVTYTTTDGTATAGSDYTAASNTLTFNPGQTSNSFPVQLVDDVAYEDPETVNLALSNLVNVNPGSPFNATLFIQDNDDPPSVFFSSPTYDEYFEDVGSATITVTLSAPSGIIVTVDYDTSDGTATAFSDYIPANGSRVFQPGQTTKTFSVTFLNDSSNEPDETINLTLSNPSNAILGAPSNATLEIRNDDGPPKLSFSSSAYIANEGDGTAPIQVNLSPPSGLTVTVHYETSDGTAVSPADYAATSGTLTFSPMQTSQSFPVPIVDDMVYEPTETVTLTLSAPVNADLGSPSDATLYIQNGTLPPTVQFSMSSYSVNEGAGTATITATLSAASAQVATVNYAATAGTATSGVDFSPTSGTLTFDPGVTTQTFPVSIVDDAIFEPTETVILTLSSPNNATLGSPGSAVLNIEDFDNPPEVFFSSAAYTVTEGVGIAQIPVTLSAASGLQVGVPYSTSDGTAIAPGDYTATSDTLIINAGLTSAAINVTIVDDNTPEGPEWLNLSLGAPTNAVLGSPSEATLNITDDDLDPLVSFSSSSYQVFEDAGSKTIDVNLSKSSDLTITVDYATSDGSAVAGSGSEFSHWSGDLTGPNNPETIVMDSNKVVTAHFAAPAPGAAPIVQTAVLEPQAPDIVTYLETQTGGATNLSSVSTSAPLTAANGHLYLAAVSSRHSIDVTGVSGLGLVWQELATQCSGRNNTGVEVWWAQGAPSGSSIVTANFAGTPNTSVIAVSRYSGVDTNDPTGNVVSANTRGLFDTICTGTSDMDSASYNFNLVTGTSNATVFSVAAIRATSHSPGASYTERFEFGAGSGGSTSAVAGQDKNVGAPAAVAVDGSFNSAVDWAVIAVEIRPDSNGGTPMYTLAINTVGDGSVLLTPPGGVYEEDTIVTLTATGAGDYTPASGTLTFAPGVTSQSFEVPVTDDGIDEFTETVNLALINQTNADLGLANAVLNITNTSLPPIVQFDSGSLDFEVAEGVGTATFTVNLIPRSEKTVTVNYTTCGGSATAGSDYSFIPGSLVFSPGEVSETFNVVIIDDQSFEPDETLCVALNTPVNATVGPNSPAVLTIAKSDSPPTVRFATSSYSVDEDAGTASINVIVVPASGFPVTVTYATTTGGTATAWEDYTPVSGTLTFDPGETSLSFTVPITDDIIAEPPVETVFLMLSNPVSATVGPPNPAQLGIFSTDPPPCVQFTVSDKLVFEDVGLAQIDVELCAASQNLVSVDYETSDGTAEAGSDYEATSGTLTFDPGETVASIYVPIVDDKVYEFPITETLYLTLNDPPINAVLGDQYTMTVTIYNVDAQVFRTFLPTVFNQFIPSEPNDECGPNALKIVPNNGYWFLPDDSVDWYWFDLPAAVDEMTVELTNFTPGPGYLALDRGTQCATKVEVASVYTSATTKTLNVGPQPAGRYWISVTNDGNFSETVNYRLIVRTE